MSPAALAALAAREAQPRTQPTSRPVGTVSIALATCNGARFVDEQLESFAAQTRPPDELHVCDDASDDDTVARVEAFGARADFDVRVERNAQRLGTTANFERAIAACGGDAIFLADQDDLWRPAKIEKMVAALDAQPAAGAVLCNGRVVDADGAPLGYDLWRALAFTGTEQSAIRAGRPHEVFLRHVVAAGTTFAFRGRYRPWVVPFPELRSAHDAWIAFLVGAVSEIALLDEALIDYRLHGDNQIGLRRHGLASQIAEAKRQIENDAFAYAVRFFEAGAARLRSAPAREFGVRAGVLAGIDAKIAHARRREEMGASFFARLPSVAAEAFSGRYGRYSYGWKSAAQDLWLR